MSTIETREPDHSNMGGVEIITLHGRKFVVGLRWHALKNAVNYMGEARLYGKENDMDIVVIREGLVTQGGFVSKKTGVTKDMYSAASVLIDIQGRSWLSVFQLEDDLFYLIAADNEAIIPDSDVIGNARKIRARMMELNSRFEWSDDQIIAPEAWNFGGKEKTLDSLLAQQNIRKQHKLKQLTFGLSRAEWIRYSAYAAALAAISTGAWIYYEREAQAERNRLAHEENSRRAELERLNAEQRRQMASSSLTRPWTLQPNAGLMVQFCEHAINSLPLTIGGWVFTQAKCTPTALVTTYTRTTGATNLDLEREFEQVFPDSDISLKNTDATASFSLAMHMPAGGDDLEKLRPNARNIFVSHFQRVDQAVKVDPIPSESIIPAFLPNGSPWPKGAPAPAPTWDTHVFMLDSEERPSNMLLGLREDGMRVAQVQVSMDADSASFSWKTVGVIYGLQ